MGLTEDTIKEDDNMIENKEEIKKDTQVEEKKEHKKEITKHKKVETKEKKNTNKSSKTKKQEKNATPDWLVITLSSALVVAVVIVLYFLFLKVNPEQTQDSVATLVNGVPIYESQVLSRMKLIQALNNPTIDRNTTLAIMTDEMLLYQEAQKEGYKTTTQEVDQYVTDLIKQNDLDENSFEKELNAAGINSNELKALYERTLTINKLINKSITSVALVSEKEIQDFYDSNKADLTIPARVQVKHILIANTKTNITAEDVKAMIKEDKSNFCDLVTEYSDDTESVSYCGEYNFSRQDPIVEEFINASFEMKPGEIRIINTIFGQHILYKIADMPEGTPSLEELRQEIESYLTNQKMASMYKEFLNSLREKAIIEEYTNETSPVLNESLTGNVINTPTKQVVKTEESTKLSLAQCLTETGAKLYTVYWCPHCEAQIKDFGEYASQLDVVECDPEGENPQVEACQEQRVTTFPTWIINGKKYEGTQSLEKLAEYSGCSN